MARQYSSRKPQRIMTGVLSTLALLWGGVAADERAQLAEREQRLQALQQDIARITDQLEAERERAGGVELELARLEQRIGAERTALAELDERIRDNAAGIQNLTGALEAAEEEAEQHRAFLADTVRAAYRRGEADTLRLLLGETDPARLQRLLVYRQHLGAARAERIANAREALETFAAQRGELEALQARHESDRRDRAEQLAVLQSSLAEREDLLAELQAQIEDTDTALAERRREADSVEQLIAELEARLAERQEDLADRPELTEARGALEWPLEGELLASFGSQRAGDMEWTGLLIGAEAGTPVRPIAPGQVVFADWLRGLGLLLIIDHGNGYLSLYGRNQMLYFEVGEQVTPSDVIATVGQTGGRPEPALYFELRAGGQPVNPLTWLREADART
ncbi:peptidoglycan DD-metalloendopeptidase family protein [Spiribacter sp. 2438]|nr:peptidoglycan DD-metalloendopeptidase family protein [Spiribacter sp. 2438]